MSNPVRPPVAAYWNLPEGYFCTNYRDPSFPAPLTLSGINGSLQVNSNENGCLVSACGGLKVEEIGSVVGVQSPTGTLEAWVWFDEEDPRPAAEAPLISRMDKWGFELRASTIEQSMVMKNPGLMSKAKEATVRCKLEPKKWHHICGTFGPFGVCIHVNGAQKEGFFTNKHMDSGLHIETTKPTVTITIGTNFVKPKKGKEHIFKGRVKLARIAMEELYYTEQIVDLLPSMNPVSIIASPLKWHRPVTQTFEQYKVSCGTQFISDLSG